MFTHFSFFQFVGWLFHFLPHFDELMNKRNQLLLDYMMYSYRHSTKIQKRSFSSRTALPLQLLTQNKSYLKRQNSYQLLVEFYEDDWDILLDFSSEFAFRSLIQCCHSSSSASSQIPNSFSVIFDELATWKTQKKTFWDLLKRQRCQIANYTFFLASTLENTKQKRCAYCHGKCYRQLVASANNSMDDRLPSGHVTPLLFADWYQTADF